MTFSWSKFIKPSCKSCPPLPWGKGTSLSLKMEGCCQESKQTDLAKFPAGHYTQLRCLFSYCISTTFCSFSSVAWITTCSGLYFLMLLSHVSCARLCATPQTAAHQASPIPGILQARTLEWLISLWGLPYHIKLRLTNMQLYLICLLFQRPTQEEQKSRRENIYIYISSSIYRNKW